MISTVKVNTLQRLYILLGRPLIFGLGLFIAEFGTGLYLLLFYWRWGKVKKSLESECESQTRGHCMLPVRWQPLFHRFRPFLISPQSASLSHNASTSDFETYIESFLHFIRIAYSNFFFVFFHGLLMEQFLLHYHRARSSTSWFGCGSLMADF